MLWYPKYHAPPRFDFSIKTKSLSSFNFYVRLQFYRQALQ